MNIAIDAGGTLIKVVCISDEGRIQYTHPTSDIDGLIDSLNAEANSTYYLTGGRASYLKNRLNGKCYVVSEFDATYAGVKYLLNQSSINVERFVYVNVGTGTSVHVADEQRQTRAIGSGVGGGTIVGLSFLLTGVKDFDELLRMSQTGNRDAIDLKVHHIYGDDEPPIPGDLTASNFAHVFHSNDMTDADKIAAVIGLVAETVTTLGLMQASKEQVRDIVFIGATFIGNTIMKDIVERYATLLGANPIFLADGEYSGAIGALYGQSSPD